MPYTKPESDIIMATRLMELRLKILDLIEKHGYTENDIRFHVLNTIASTLHYSLMRINFYLACKSKKIPHELIVQLTGTPNWDLKLFEDDVKFTRIGFLTLIQFQIENFMKILLSNLEENDPPRKYYEIVEKILKLLELKDIEIKKGKLNVLAYMRNSLHSNGIHTNSPKTFEIDSHKFEFIKNKSSHNTSWAEIIFALEHVTDIINEIIEHQKIKDIKKQLPLSYIPNVDTSESDS